MNIKLTNHKRETLIVEYSPTNVRIYNSYAVDKSDMSDWIARIRIFGEQYGYVYSRTNQSWANEWEAHNLLFKLGICPTRTKDVDLNEDETALRKIGYFLLSRLY